MIERGWALPIANFLTPEALATLWSQLSQLPAQAAPVYKATGGTQLSQPERRTQLLALPPAFAQIFQARLSEYLPVIAQNFKQRLNGFEPPAILRYQAGDYYLPHIDWHQDLENKPELHYIRPRRLSAILFLNAQSDNPPPPGRYSGGDLLFHFYPPEVAQPTSLCFPSAPGTLLLFLPHLVHEVTPVLGGERYTLVTWLN